MKIYRPLEALNEMGLLCAKSSADVYIINMNKAGLLKTSYKLSNRWHITETDILYIRDLIMAGKYKPTSKYLKNGLRGMV